MPVSAAVVVEDLVVRYGDFTAVDGVSFTAEPGQVTAVLGPNGAGKTSTLEVCEGYRAPFSGKVVVLGLNPWRQQVLLSRHMGVMLQDGGVSNAARVSDVVRLYCDLYDHGIQPAELLDTVGLSERASSTYRRLSGGEKQRLSLALALASKPQVAFLDEPTSGVDISGRQRIRQIVSDLAATGCAVVLATHELDEAEKLADQVIIFNRGKVVANAPLITLRQGHDIIRFTSSPNLNVAALAAAMSAPVQSPTPGTFEISCDASRVGPLTTWLTANGHPLLDLRAGQQRLEDVVLRLTGEQA